MKVKKSQEVKNLEKNVKKRNKGKDTKIRTYLTYKGAAKKMEEYGSKYAVKDFLKQIAVIVAITIVASYMLKLEYQMSIIVAAAGLLSILPLTIVRYKAKYEQEKYLNLITYMEQMIMCFRIQPKILYAMTEAAKNLTNKKMKQRVNKACQMIYEGTCEKGQTIYGTAFKEIEKYYPCDYLSSLHKLLEKVEMSGGDFQGALNVFFDDLQLWSERVRKFQYDKSITKKHVVISIALSLAICIVMGLVMPKSIKLTETMLYQVSTVIAILLSLFLYICLEFTTAKSWFIFKRTPDDQIIKDYNKAVHFDMPKEIKNARIRMVLGILTAIAGLILKAVGYCTDSQSTMFIVTGIIIAVLFYTKPKRIQKSVINRTKNEIEKAFPDWLRDIALTAQTKTVQNAVVESYASAPIVLKPAIKKMVGKFATDPVGNSPYITFLEEFDLPEIKAAVKTLYTINEIGKEELQNQINSIIAQNNKLADRAEEIKNENTIAAMQLQMQIPMFFAAVKMICDMISIITSFITYASNIL